MTRYLYAGGAVVSTSGVPLVNASAQVYSLRTGGSIVTDILSTGGTPLAGTVTTDANGQVLFQGPDGIATTYWLQFASGPRWQVTVAAIPADLDAAAAAKTTKTTKALLHYGNAETQTLAGNLDSIVVPHYASSAARDTANPTPGSGDLHARTDQRGNMFRWDSTSSKWRDATVIVADTTARAAAFPSPVDGDRVYRADIRATEVYHSLGTQWIVSSGPRAGLKTASAAATTTANPSPSDGDRTYRTDIHADMTYSSLTSTYHPLRTLLTVLTISSSVASVSYSSIPQDFRHLSIEVPYVQGASASTFFIAQFNGDTATNYGESVHYAYASPGTWTLGGAWGDSFALLAPCGVTATTTQAKVLDYSLTDVWKSFNARGSHMSATTSQHGASITSGMWKSNSAITSILFKATAGNLTAGRILIYGER